MVSVIYYSGGKTGFYILAILVFLVGSSVLACRLRGTGLPRYASLPFSVYRPKCCWSIDRALFPL